MAKAGVGIVGELAATPKTLRFFFNHVVFLIILAFSYLYQISVFIFLSAYPLFLLPTKIKKI